MLLYRRIRFGYPFRRIPLTKGKFAIVDPEDYDRLMQYKWQAQKGWSTWYAKRTGRCTKTRRRRCIMMHRVIMRAPADLMVDHINFNGLDNRKANLRIVTNTQNNCHRRKLDKSKVSKHYKGIYWDNRTKRWTAAVKINRKMHYFGSYQDQTEAAKAYDKGAKQLHGEFAVLNFPDESD